MANTRGVFTLERIREKYLLQDWPDSTQVWLDDSNTRIANTGYFGGGTPDGTGNYTTMDKVTYASDTTAAVPGAALTVARWALAATGSSACGYFGGGINAAPNPNLVYSTMDKVTY